MNEKIVDIKLPVTAIIGKTGITVGELSRLRAGNVLPLDKNTFEPVDVLVSDELVATAEVVTIEGHLGLRIKEILRHKDELPEGEAS